VNNESKIAQKIKSQSIFQINLKNCYSQLIDYAIYIY